MLKPAIAGSGGMTATAVARYDRLRTAGDWVRVHQEDLCQAFALPPTSKHQTEGGPSREQFVGLLSGSHVRLAPLHDIASALHDLDSKRLKLPMKIGDEYSTGSNP